MTCVTRELTLKQAAEHLLASDRIVVTTHAKPDGDAFGSVVAMTTALRRMGKQVRGVLAPPVPGSFDGLAGRSAVELFDSATRFTEAQFVVVVDTRAWSQVAVMRTRIEPLLTKTLVIDHHLNGDMAPAWQWVDGGAAACCELIAELIAEFERQAGQAGVLFDATVAEALFVGIASDTGWFRFSNTTARTHRWAARLLERGVDQSRLYSELEQGERPQKLALLRRALDSVELVADGRIALMHLHASDFAETGARAEETERFVDVPQMVGSVEAVVLAVEIGPSDPNGAAGAHGVDGNGGGVRLSFRSKARPDAMNVAELAARFGGGGHARAAGAKVAGELDQVLDTVRRTLVAAV